MNFFLLSYIYHISWQGPQRTETSSSSTPSGGSGRE